MKSDFNQWAEFNNKGLEIQYREEFWNRRKKYFLLAYFICTILFFFHGLFDFNRDFFYSSPAQLLALRGFFLILSATSLFYFWKKSCPKYIYEIGFFFKLYSVLIILLLTIFTKGQSSTLHIGVMIMAASFYVMLPSRSVYSLISSALVTSVYLFLGDKSDENFGIISFIIVSSNFILWYFCLNYHRFNRLEFLHQKHLEETGILKNKILTTLAHDIRTPLSVIMMRSDLGIKMFKEEENGHKQFKNILNNTKKINDLIQDLISWTIEKDDIKDSHQDNKKQSILSTIEKAVNFQSDFATHKNIEVCILIEDIDIGHDSNMVTTIFRNLLSNAIKFSKNDSEIHIKNYNNNPFKIAIHDTAPEISDDVKKNIINGKNSESTQGSSGEKGSGVGLRLVHTFLKAHNATLDIKRNKHGNVFIISFKDEFNLDID